MTVSINSDLGESLGIHSFGHDDELLPFIDQANVACGLHAGDPSSMYETVQKAGEAGVAIGAHPGLPDPVGFGRREMHLPSSEVRDLVLYQVGALTAFLQVSGFVLSHIKPHGSLYGMAARDESIMGAVCEVAAMYGVAVYGMAGTAHESVARERGIPFVSEFYVDLPYRMDGSLVIARRVEVTPFAVAAERARLALAEGVTVAITGERLPVVFESICIHSDGPNAVEVARAVRGVVGGRAIKEAAD